MISRKYPVWIGLFFISTLTAMERVFVEAPLFQAIESGRLEAVRPLVNADTNLEVLSYVYLTPLQVAAQGGHAAIVQFLLQKGALIDAQSQGLTALHIAALKGHPMVVKVLLDGGANPDARITGEPELQGATVLHAAVSSGNTDTVRYVLLHKHNNPRHEREDHTSLTAQLYGALASAGRWLERCLHPKAKILRGYTAVHMAAKMGHHEVVTLLLESGENPEAQTADGTNPLHEAVSYDRAEVIRVLIKANVNIEAPLRLSSVEAVTPLFMAAYRGNVNAVRELLAAGPDINAQTREGVTSLLAAAMQGYDEVVKLLLEAGALPNKDIRPAPAYSPLLGAVDNDHKPVAKRLLEAGAHVNARIQRGIQAGATSLHLAALKNNLDLCKLLVCFLKMPVDQLLSEMGEGRAVSISSLCSKKAWRDRAAQCILTNNNRLLDEVYACLEDTHPLKRFFAPGAREKIIAALISTGLENDQHVSKCDQWGDDQLFPFDPSL